MNLPNIPDFSDWDEYPELTWTTLLGFRGSIAHNMYIPPEDPVGTDDIDLMGVCVMPPEYYLGLPDPNDRMFNGTLEIQVEPFDIVIYELRKYIGLLVKGNPNALSLLWIPDELHLQHTYVGRWMLERRDLFVSKEFYYAFDGYLMNQYQRMLKGIYKGSGGAKRAALRAKFGYDVKHAAHCIRLARMGIEFLSTGKLQIWRDDSDELIAIKQGQWSLERVKREIQSGIQALLDAYESSPLPNQLDMQAVRDITYSWVGRGIYDVHQVWID